MRARKPKPQRRTGHIPAMTVEALRSHRKARSNRFGLVFTDPIGVAIRNAANSILLAQGENVLTLAQRVGHYGTRMTLEAYSYCLAQYAARRGP